MGVDPGALHAQQDGGLGGREQLGLAGVVRRVGRVEKIGAVITVWHPAKSGRGEGQLGPFARPE